MCSIAMRAWPAVLLLLSGMAQSASDGGKPDGLTLAGTFRVRFETLDEQFRALRSGSDQVLVERITATADYRNRNLRFGAEIIDSRAWLDDEGSVTSTGIVNPLDILQLYTGWQHDLAEGSGDLRIGRFTMDVGSRRFVSRNRFRNTINSFTGVDWRWRSSAREFRAFYTLPVRRKPVLPGELRDNDREADEQDSEVRFWGLFYARDHDDTTSFLDRSELFYFGLSEDDSSGRPTANRSLSTVGFRVLRSPSVLNFDYQLEAVHQSGESRASALALRDLDHRAYFVHAEIGYTFDRMWHPRIVFQYDWASGDDHPLDSDNERFTTLYGARRFDFGPTGIYGPFARANLSSPGIRLQLRPVPGISGFLAYRTYSLASDRDSWVPARLRDPTGRTDGYIGSQLEARLRWDVRPKRVRIETGLAYLFAGDFMDEAPNSNGQGDATYFYSQVAFQF
jgi:hypothetical protein